MLFRSIAALRMAGTGVSLPRMGASREGLGMACRLRWGLLATGRCLHGQVLDRVSSGGRGSVVEAHRCLLQTRLARVARRSMAGIAEGGVGTHKPSTFQKRILVLAKMYPSVDKVPDRVTRNQLSVAMDKFRVRACIIMVAATFITAAIVAMIGRRERQQGITVETLAEARRRS